MGRATNVRVLRCRIYGYLKKDITVEDVMREYKEGEGVQISTFDASRLLDRIADYYDDTVTPSTEGLEKVFKQWEEDYVCMDYE